MVSPMSLYNRTDRLLDSDSSRGAYAGVKVRNGHRVRIRQIGKLPFATSQGRTAGKRRIAA